MGRGGGESERGREGEREGERVIIITWCFTPSHHCRYIRAKREREGETDRQRRSQRQRQTETERESESRRENVLRVSVIMMRI